MSFRGSNPMIPTEKINHKKDFYDTNAIQSIKSELLSNNTTLSSSSKVFFSSQEQNFVNSFEDDEFASDNIDVETDSDNDQQITELKQMNYVNLSDVSMKHEEWSKIVKSSMIKSSESPTATENNSPHVDDQEDPTHQHATQMKIDTEKCAEDVRTNLKRVCLPDDDETEYYNDSYTNQSLINLSERKRGKYGNGRGFSIENIIGRMVEDR